MRKRLLAILLSTCMLLSLLPVTALAAGDAIVEMSADGTEVKQYTASEVTSFFSDLQDATTADVKMLNSFSIDSQYIPVKEGQNVTLDFNGCTLSKSDNSTYAPIENYGTMILKDTSTAANGGISGENRCVNNYGTMTIEGGKYSTTNTQGGTAIQNKIESAVMTINDCTVTAGVFAFYNAGTATINGGKFENYGSCSSCNPNGWAYTAKSVGTLYVNGGEIHGVQGALGLSAGYAEIRGGTFYAHACKLPGHQGEGSKNAFYGLYVAGEEGDVKCVVYDGNIISEGKYAAALVGNDNTNGDGGINADATSEIKGGTFTATLTTTPALKGAPNTGNPIITGGTFSSDVSEYVPAGYIQNGNTVEKLGETNAVAKIGTTYYETLLDAYAAIPRGDTSKVTTIEVLKNCEGGSFGSDSDKGMNYVIDFGGHTYTAGPAYEGSTGYKNQCIRVLEGSTAVFKNGTVKAATDAGIMQVMHTYGNVTLQDFTVDATAASSADAYEADCGTLNILGNSSILASDGNVGLYVAFWPRGGYLDGTTVTIDTTGEITGKLTYEWDDKSDVNQQQTENRAFLNIKNGCFDFSNIETLFTSTIPADLKIPKITISGGLFNSDVTEYCTEGLMAVANTDEATNTEYPFMIGEPKVAEEVEVENHEQAGETQSAVSDNATVGLNDTEKNDLIAKAGAVVPSENADKNLTGTAPANTASEEVEALKRLDEAGLVKFDPSTGKVTAPENSEEGMPAPTVTIVKTTYLDVTVTEYDKTKKLTLDIEAKYDVKATTGDPQKEESDGGISDANTVTLATGKTLDVKNKEIEIVIPLPDGFAADGGTLFITHDKGNGEKYIYTGEVAEGKLTFLNPNGFSTFSVTPNDPSVAKIGEKGYASLQLAINAANNNQEIVLQEGFDTTETVKVEGKSVIINLSGKDYNLEKVEVPAGANYKKELVNGKIVVTYTRPSSGGSSSGSITYAVTVADSANGTITVSPKSASKGSTVTITVNPDDGFELDELIVTDKNGTEIELTKKDGKFTFKMPASKVEVTASFAEIVEELPFVDVPDNAWYVDAVGYAYKNGMMNGTGQTTFSPDLTTSRGMIVTILYRADGSPAAQASSDFQDVSADQYYSDAVAWASENGIVGGYGNGNFGPNDPITREQMAAILYRYAQYKGMAGVTLEENLLGFSDHEEVSGYAVQAMNWAVGQGLINGTDTGMLVPQGNATRAQVAVILMRFCENVLK